MERRAYTNLASYLKHSGETQQAFADRLGVTQSHISRICNGLIEPSLDLALQIAAIANIPIESMVPNATSSQVHAGGDNERV